MAMTPEDKQARYERVREILERTFRVEKPEGMDALETFVTALHQDSGDGLPHFWWCGIYRLARLPAGDRQLELVCGSSPACSPLPVAPRTGGVCSDCALTEKPVVVPDVAVYPGHVYCDSRARSEVVIPLFDEADNLVGVLDVDDLNPGSFDHTDVEWLERLSVLIRPYL